MNKPVLYNFRRCPYAMRARMALAASGIEPEFREVKLREKPAEMLEASPKGTVPVLVLENGKVIDESIDVMRWALGRNDPENWLQGADFDLIEMNDGPFKHHLDRYKYSTRHGSDAEEHRAACLAILRDLDERIGTGPYLHGQKPGLTDAAIMPFVRQFAATDREWFDTQPIPNVRRWLDTMLESELFKAVMVKRDQWRPEAG
ncbi:glutathione S-transferase [Altererythrobacter luteolus]|uniref:Glutathione S-transferase n=1 Tax=Pontixanthobacter luteolus TaxID=295089 RepID=A0A6I4V357_9SPHN|nr:glutathione S-transferase [Pontixanthobacter luteolus]MXP48343.1 glutathione S-transferase [Pontixanthobacter luteolus]